jgi:16S rRNA processing protein RimM
MEDVAIGKVRTSHGVRGFLKVMSFSGETDHFFQLKEVVLRISGKNRSFLVEEIKTGGPGNLFIKLEGIDTPEEGKRWAGAELLVPKEAGAALGEDEYYYSDLIGSRLLFEGLEVGKVLSIIENGVTELLEIQTGAGTKIVPFQNPFIGKVDTAERTIELLEYGLLE